jgi:Ser/Thr protein kinase RdoA (MazF antagonist)
MTKIVDQETLNLVLSHYNCSINNSTISPLGNGLINATFLVRNINANFVLQRINKNVFPNPEQVINNAELINNHLLAKQKQQHYSLQPIWQVSNKNDQPLVIVDGDYWRAIQYIPNCYTVEELSTPEQAIQVAKAFAQFTSALSDFPAASLAEIIPDFHNLNHRIAQLEAVIAKDPKNRLASCQTLVDFIQQQQKFINDVAELIQKLPLQVTHNDTKINNLLFCSANKEPLAVIDLDTCMPGYLMHDFGDLIRTCCSNLPEDGVEIDSMEIRFDIFSALAKGYIESFGNKMSTLEKQSLVIGAQLLPLMVSIRFLTDYIDGDNYFHVEHAEHNLMRAKNQLHMYSLLNQYEQKGKLSNIILANN